MSFSKEEKSFTWTIKNKTLVTTRKYEALKRLILQSLVSIMRTIYLLTTLTFLLFCLSGFSQNDSLSAVSRLEINRFHHKIFKLSVDPLIDSTSFYRLVYSSGKSWSQGPNNPNPRKKYRSKYFRKNYGNKKDPLSQILDFPKPSPVDKHPNLTNGNNLFSRNHIVSSKKEDTYKRLLRKKYDYEFEKSVIFLGGKYLLVAKKMVYRGNTSWGSIQYLYYEKAD